VFHFYYTKDGTWWFLQSYKPFGIIQDEPILQPLFSHI